MASDEVQIDDSFPIFETIEALADRDTTPSVPSDVVVETSDLDDVRSVVVSSTPISDTQPKRRGRPKGSRNRPKDGSPIFPTPADVETKLTGRLAKDVSLRGQQVLKGVTKIPALWIPPVQMQDDEAQQIADPLASYATRKAEESTAIAEFIRSGLDNFDLIAAAVGVSSYVIRVVKDIREYNDYAREVRSGRIVEPSRERVEESRTEFERTVERPRPPTRTKIEDNSGTSGNPAPTNAFEFVSTPAIGQL